MGSKQKPNKAEKAKVEKAEEIEACVTRFNTATGTCVKGIIERGQILLELKELAHRTWEKVKARLDDSDSQIEMLMRIAKHPELANAQNFVHLPPSVPKLADLSKLKEPGQVTKLIKARKIHRRMTGEAARELAGVYKSPQSVDQRQGKLIKSFIIPLIDRNPKEFGRRMVNMKFSREQKAKLHRMASFWEKVMEAYDAADESKSRSNGARANQIDREVRANV